jgi:polysaccharide export outer membrane protein
MNRLTFCKKYLNIPIAMFCRVCLGGVILIALTVLVWAQEESQPTAVKNPVAIGAMVDNIHDINHRIVPGDLLDIQIEKAPELSGQVRVDATGQIYLKFLGDIQTQNLKLDELNKKITEGLRGRYLNDPHVRVTMVEYYKHSFIVQGGVIKPGIYQFIEAHPTFWSLIVQAGGFNKECGTTAFVIRTKKTSGETASADDSNQKADSEAVDREVIKVKISGLMKGDLRQDIQLSPGDVVTVPPADVFFIAGEVNAPGRFTLADGTSLRQAISLAQGTSITANKSNGKIFRENPSTGALEEVNVDIGAIMDGKKPDILLVANDIVMVPGSRFKSVGTALLRSLGLGTGQIPFRRY